MSSWCKTVLYPIPRRTVPFSPWEGRSMPVMKGSPTWCRRNRSCAVRSTGICLGGQLLASALGAPVVRKGLTEIGFFDAQLTAEGMSDPLFAGLPGYQHIFHWHEDTFTLPEGAQRLAVRPGAPEQAFRYRRRAY